MPKPPEPRKYKFTTGFGLEVERLLKKMPGGGVPDLEEKDEDESGAPFNAASSGWGSTPANATTKASLRAPSPRRSTSVSRTPGFTLTERHVELLGAWSRTLSAAALGAAVLWWPYARDCGWLLHAYLGVIAAVLVAGGWASITAWRGRVAAAHVLALVVMFWGTVLAAEEILPRIGYAATSAIWTCSR